MNITAKELSGNHIGKTVTVANIGTATIWSIEHVEGFTRVRLDPRMENGTHTLLLRHDIEVTIQEGQ